jgi:hypothetical protein
MTDIKSTLRRVCQMLEQAGDHAAPPTDMAALTALATAAKAGEDIDAELAALAARLGISDRPARRAIPDLYNVGAGHMVADLYVCPAGICSRTWLNVPGKGHPPYCPLNGSAMRQE